jgi:non-ribosomal peptide synthetase component F
LPIQYADFAAWQQQWLRGELIEKELAYWTRRLANAPKLKLLSKRPGPANPSFKGAHSSFALPDELTTELNLLSMRAGVSLFMTLLAAYAVLLHYYSGQEDIVVGAPIASRDPRETETLIGLFINLLVLRIDLSGDPSFRDLLDRVREVTLDAYAHQNLPFEKLVEHLRPERIPGENPLFQVSFTLDNTPDSELKLPDLTFVNKDLTIETAQYDLVLHVMHKGGRLFGVLQYKTDLFDQEVIQMPKDFELILRRLTERPEIRVGELREALSQSDKRHWIEEERQLETISLRRLRTVTLESRNRQLPHSEAVQ